MPDCKTRIFHITTKNEADKAKREGIYEPSRFVKEGFIHCSYASQVVGVANAIYQGQKHLVLLEIEISNLDCEVVDEDLYGSGALFPHIYGSLPWDAVVAIHEFPCAENGTFQLPPTAGA